MLNIGQFSSVDQIYSALLWRLSKYSYGETMKTFYYLGPNKNNKSRVSWKMWKIEQKERHVTVWWGPATIVGRKITPTSTLQTRSWKYSSEDKAKADEKRRIEEKLSGGYKKQLHRKIAQLT